MGFAILETAETLSVAALVLFNGVLNSRYFEKLPIKPLENYLWYPVGLLILAGYFTAMRDFCPQWEWVRAAVVIGHTMLLFVMGVLLTVVVGKFSEISFRYERQYLYARAMLYSSLVMTTIAIGVYGVCYAKFF